MVLQRWVESYFLIKSDDMVPAVPGRQLLLFIVLLRRWGSRVLRGTLAGVLLECDLESMSLSFADSTHGQMWAWFF